MKKDNNDKLETKKPDLKVPKIKAPADDKTDTAPDEFLGPNADTDQPVDGQVINDAVLRGEPNTHDDLPGESSGGETPKMDTGK